MRFRITDLRVFSRIPVDITGYQNDMITLHGKDDILTMFIHLGYLGYDRETGEVIIPNKEVLQAFSLQQNPEIGRRCSVAWPIHESFWRLPGPAMKKQMRSGITNRCFNITAEESSADIRYSGERRGERRHEQRKEKT